MTNERIKLCNNCHTPLHKPITVYPTANYAGWVISFCNKVCRRQWSKLSLEQRRQLFWMTARQENNINQLNLFGKE